MPTFTEFDLQESFPLCPHCADDALAKRIEERFLSFEMFDDIDDLKLQEVCLLYTSPSPRGPY